MLTSLECWKKYGDPSRYKNITKFYVPETLRKGPIPKVIYCNRDLIPHLLAALNNLVLRKKVNELKSWDGCFCIRPKVASSSMSLHAWGLAVDVNATTNGFGKEPTLSPGFVKCWTDAGFDWGGYWITPVGRHFQLKE